MSEAQRRPGGRTARVRDDVHAAVTELIRERGDESLSIADVAERSGVHHATIYRRWGSIEAILIEVAEARIEAQSPIPDTGSLRGDLLAYARGAAGAIQGPEGLALLRASLAQSRGESDEPPPSLVQRARGMQLMLDRATGRGERSLHFTDVLDGILAPIYLRVLLGIGGIDAPFLEDLVDRTLRR